MAKEISTTVTVSMGKGSNKVGGSVSTTEDSAGYVGFQQLIGTTAETIVFPTDVGTPKVVYIQNLDTTFFVEIDKASSPTWAQKLAPGQAILLRPESATLFAKSDPAATASVPIWIVAG